MKKSILSLVVILASYFSFAQVTFYVNSPSAFSGNYMVTYADPGGGWGCPDMLDPANAIIGELALVDDGTTAGNQNPGDLACEPLVNSAEITGKIAVLWRGDCEFGLKALNAQNAGAIAVVIVNHTGDPVGMAPGANGASVTIPVVMISQQAGEDLLDEIIAGGVTVFIGNKFGYFADDVGFNQKDVLRAKQFATPQLLAQNGSEFSVDLGCWLFNFGSNDQTGVTVTANIEFGGSNIYTQISGPVNILSGDSVWVSFPSFSQTSYAIGLYEMSYSTEISSVTDDFDADNEVISNFMITTEKFAYSRLNPTTLEPVRNAGYRPASATGSVSSCLVFRDANANRLAIKGMTFAASTNADNTLNGELVELQAWQWNDVFTDLDDPGFNISALNFITNAEYSYDSDDQNVYYSVIFEEPFALINNQRYLFCLNTSALNIFMPYDTGIDYDENLEEYIQPMFPGENAGSWFALGFGTDIVPAITANFIPVEALSIEENDNNSVEIIAYPNPAVNEITVPFGTQKGMTTLNIYDVSGKLVSTQTFEITGEKNIKVDVSNIENGLYFFNVNFENGTASTFNVVVNK